MNKSYPDFPFFILSSDFCLFFIHHSSFIIHNFFRSIDEHLYKCFSGISRGPTGAAPGGRHLPERSTGGPGGRSGSRSGGEGNQVPGGLQQRLLAASPRMRVWPVHHHGATHRTGQQDRAWLRTQGAGVERRGGGDFEEGVRRQESGVRIKSLVLKRSSRLLAALPSDSRLLSSDFFFGNRQLRVQFGTVALPSNNAIASATSLTPERSSSSSLPARSIRW